MSNENENEIEIIEEEISIEDKPINNPDAAQSANDESKSSGDSIFAKLKKNRQARMDAVGEDDDYDIFDLQDIMDIDDDFVDDGFFDAEDEGKAEDSAKKSKRPSLFSKAKKDKPAKEQKGKKGKKKSVDEAEIPQENEILPQEEEFELEAEDEEFKEEAVEETTEVEEEPVKEYVSPIKIQAEEDLQKVNQSIDEINRSLESAHMKKISPIEGKNESRQSIEDEIQSVINAVPSGGTIIKNIAAGKREPKIQKQSEDNQITLEEFDNETITPQLTNEAEEERQLKKKRKSFAEHFHLDPIIKTSREEKAIETEETADVVQDVEVQNGENVFDAVERQTKNKTSFIEAIRQRIVKETKEQNLLSIQELADRLQTDGKKYKISIVIELILCLALLIFSIIVSSYEPGGSLDALFAHRARFVVLANLVLFGISLAVAHFRIKESISKIKSGIIGYNLAYLFFLCVVLLQHIVALCTGLSPASGYTVYAFPAAVLVLADLLSRQIGIISLKKSQKYIFKQDLFTLKPIELQEDSSPLGYGLVENGEPSIYFTSPAAVPSSLPYAGSQTGKEKKKYLRFVAFSIVASVILTVIACIVNKSAMPIVTVLPCSICICLPVGRELVLSLLKSDVNKSAKLSGVTVLDYDSCDGIAKSNAVVADIKNIFRASVSNYKKAYGCRMAMLDTVVYSACVINSSKSILVHCFDEYLAKANVELPEVEEFSYEENLGFSAWVNNAKVIVGNRTCMANHSIKCPNEEQEKQYCPDGCVMYTAVNNQIVSTFIVNYSVNLKSRKQMQELSKTGIVIILNGMEPALSEDEAAQLLQSSVAAIKIISSSGIEIIERNRQKQDSSTPGILASASKNGALQAVLNAFRLSTGRRISAAILSIFCVISFVVLALFAISKVSIAFTPLTLTLFLGFGSVISYILSRIIIK